MTAQPDLFAAIDAENRLAETISRNWGTRTPKIGDYVNTDSILGTKEDGTTLYCYMESIRLVEQRADGKWVGVIDMGLVEQRADGKWVGVIDMGLVHGLPWYKDGTRLVMALDEMHPEYRRHQ